VISMYLALKKSLAGKQFAADADMMQASTS
jgi:hypothetical protein